jgi:hypothetical protein
MRWCVALAVVLVALVAATVKVSRRTPRPVVAPKPEITAAVAPAPSFVPRPPPTPEPPPARHETGGIAHLRGRVLAPPGTDTTQSLKVVAEEGDRTIIAETLDGGRFQFHIPPGRYTLLAGAGEWVGVVQDVVARAGTGRDVDIRLERGATIRGTLRGGHDVDVDARPAGKDFFWSDTKNENGTFTVAGLIPGRAYDLVFKGVNSRVLIRPGVTAPADGLDVELHDYSRVRGAIGFPRDGECPISGARLRINGDDQAEYQNVDRACTFDLSVQFDAPEVTVVATGQGWHLEETVAIPATGDPPPLCLNPPCLSDKEKGIARLRLTLDGKGDAPWISASTWHVAQGSGDPSRSCWGQEGSCDVDGLAAGEAFRITATGDNCSADPVTVTVVAGDNYVRLPCHRERTIEGVIRVPEDQRPDSVVVRCAGGSWEPLINTRLFKISCAADAASLEYRIGTKGTLRSVPIASLAGAGPAFVDIGN